MSRDAAVSAFELAAANGHSLHDAPGMVQLSDGRWDCRVCGCYLWVREHGRPYGTALSAPCSTLVGRGRVRCDRCCLSWEWPGTLTDEAAGRAYLTQHACGPSNMLVTVIAPAAGKPSQPTTTDGR